MAEAIEIRQLTTIDELKEMQALEQSVWNMPAMPIHHTYTTLLNGGIILGAYDESDMVGFLYSFAGFDGKAPYVCSHMLGIDAAYRKRGIGVRMKEKQRKLAKEIGYASITWTFDPLESVNAYLNIEKLGAKGVVYSPNHYGEMEDQLNEGLPSDRIHILWEVAEKGKEVLPPFEPSRVLLNRKKDAPVVRTFTEEMLEAGGAWFVAIPNAFQQLKEEDADLALQWRMDSRAVFERLFRHGYIASGVYREAAGSYYVFTKDA